MEMALLCSWPYARACSLQDWRKGKLCPSARPPGSQCHSTALGFTERRMGLSGMRFPASTGCVTEQGAALRFWVVFSCSASACKTMQPIEIWAVCSAVLKCLPCTGSQQQRQLNWC